MRRNLSCIFALSAATLLLPALAGADGSVAAAGEASFASPASFRGVAVTSVDLGVGVGIEDGGAASGALHLGLRVPGGAEIAVEATARSGVMNADGSASVAGEAFIGAGAGLPAAGPVPFQATLAPEGIALEIGGEPLPVALLSAGGISVEEGR